MTQAKANISFQETFCIEKIPEACAMIIFGASGDLTHRKLIPSLLNLFKKELLPPHFYILGCARKEMTDETFRKDLFSSLQEQVQFSKEEKNNFLKKCFYLAGNYQDPKLYEAIQKRLAQLDQENGVPGNHLFYLSVPSLLYQEVISHLGKASLTQKENRNTPGKRVIIEKPHGQDLASAMALDRELHQVLREEQIYRIDHYLGKETVQNILMFRFVNTLFEHVWNRDLIDHVQITVAESIGIEHRAGYFETAGTLRDMFQNHLLQLLALIAMDPPTSFEADAIADEKAKLLRAIQPFPLPELGEWMIRGQYTHGTIDGKAVPGYRAEEKVAKDSSVETFVAAKFLINNWRWEGVPFYLRSGKRLAKRMSEIAITFKRVPHSMFHPLPKEALSPNTLVFNVQPDEGVSLAIQAKHPGPKLCIGTLNMDYNYREVFGLELPDAYERLLLDCMLGDQTLFLRQDGLELAWSLLTPILQAGKLYLYPAGASGPEAASDLLARDGRSWRPL